jgi:hypothetical protein
MKEPWIDGLKRRFHDLRTLVVKKLIFWLVHRLDVLQYGAFMALSWGYDEVTDYHVLAERSYDDMHVYGTQVTYYNKQKGE